MADKKISELDAIPAIAADDLFAIVDATDATTKKGTMQQVAEGTIAGLSTVATNLKAGVNEVDGALDTHVAAANPHSGSAASGANADITSLQDGVTTTTQSPGDNSTKLSTTAYTDLAVTAATEWGSTRTGTAGVGLTHTIGASAVAGTQSMATTLNNTQSNALIAHWIDLGTSALGHTGLAILAYNEHASTKAISINMGGSPGVGVNIIGNDNYVGFSVGGTTTDSAHIGYRYTSALPSSAGTSFYTDVNVSGGTVHVPFYANVQSSQDNFNRTTDLFTLLCTRPHQSGVVKTDNFNMGYIKRNVTGVGSFSQGTVWKLENSCGLTTDTVKILELIQDADSTGVPLNIVQNAVVSTNFRKISTEENTGVTKWISDGTNPNGVLTGAAGDVCFNGASSKVYHCTGTTVWVTTYTTDEVDDLLGGVNFDYFFSDTAEGVIGGYNLMYPADTGEGESTIAVAITADPTLIKAFITESTEPNFTSLLSGVYNSHFHAAKTAGTIDAYVYAELYKRVTGGAETLLATSENTPLLAGSNTAYNVHFSLPTDVSLLTTDRLVTKFYGSRSGTGTNPTVTLYLEGANASRIEVKTDSGVLEDKFLVKSGLPGGQSATGGTGAGEKFTINSTSDATKGGIEIGATDTLKFASGGATINEFSTDTTMVGNSDTALPTEKAVKTYVDAHTANGMWDRVGTIIAPSTAGDTLDLETGDIKFTTGATIDEFSTDGTLAGDSDTAVSTEKAVKTYVDASLTDIPFTFEQNYSETLGAGTVYHARARCAGTINLLDGILGAGSLTIVVSINATPITHPAFNVTTGGVTVTPTAANTFVSGDLISFVTSNIVNPVRLLLTMRYTRTF